MQWNLEATGVRVAVITLKPRSQTVPPGGTATFKAAATDPRGVVIFQWFHNEQPIPGANSSNLTTIVNVDRRRPGQYRLAVTNSVRRSSFTAPVDLEIGPVASVQSKDKIAEVANAGEWWRRIRGERRLRWDIFTGRRHHHQPAIL